MNPAIARRRRAKSAHLQTGHGDQEQQCINVGDMERQISMWGGTALAAYGLLSRSVTGLALAAIGAGFIWRGHTGHCSVYQALGMNSNSHSQNQPDSRHRREHQFQGHETHAAGDAV